MQRPPGSPQKCCEAVSASLRRFLVPRYKHPRAPRKAPQEAARAAAVSLYVYLPPDSVDFRDTPGSVVTTGPGVYLRFLVKKWLPFTRFSFVGFPTNLKVVKVVSSKVVKVADPHESRRGLKVVSYSRSSSIQIAAHSAGISMLIRRVAPHT